MGKREQVRIGTLMAFATNKIQGKLKQGQKIRDDGFFTESPKNRSSAEEIFEGVILAAQRDHEEKKLRFYGNLVANIAFDNQIDRTQANLLLRLGQNISYQQMCLLMIFVTKEQFGLRQIDYRGVGSFSMHLVSVLHEICGLYKNYMVQMPNDTILGLTDVNPGKLNVIGNGERLYNLMELHELDSEDYLPLVQLLKQ